jgi:hypothetical protein
MAKFLLYLKFVMSLVFIGTGILLPLRPPALFAGNPVFVNYVMGFILISYGLLRFWRAYQESKAS